MINVIVEVYDFNNVMYNVSARLQTLEISASLEKPCVEAKMELYHNVFDETNTNLPIYIQPRI